MLRRRTALQDGRYLIYYTFEEEGGGEDAGAQAEAPRKIEAEASEEPHV